MTKPNQVAATTKKTRTKPTVNGKMTILYPDSMGKNNKVFEYNGFVPTPKEIQSEIHGRYEQINSFKKFWQLDENGIEVAVNCVCFGHHMGQIVCPVNEYASYLHLEQAGGELRVSNPSHYALFGPIAIFTGTRAFLNRV